MIVHLPNPFPEALKSLVFDRFRQFIGIVNAYCKSLRRLHSQTWFRQSQIMWTEPWAEPFDGWESLEKILTRNLFGGNAPINWVRKWKNTQSCRKTGHKKKYWGKVGFASRTDTGQSKSKVPVFLIQSKAPLARLFFKKCPVIKFVGGIRSLIRKIMRPVQLV